MTLSSAVKKILGTAALGLVLALGAAGVAGASHMSSYYGEQTAACWGDRVVIGAPLMLPTPATAYTHGNSQVVSFRSSLARWYPGHGWFVVQYGTWKKTRVGDTSLGVGYSWTTMDDRPVIGQETFFITQSGTSTAKLYYGVFTEYRWHKDSTHHDYSDWDWNPHHENRASQWNQKSYDWCEYPGPNEFVIR